MHSLSKKELVAFELDEEDELFHVRKISEWSNRLMFEETHASFKSPRKLYDRKLRGLSVIFLHAGYIQRICASSFIHLFSSLTFQENAWENQ